MQETYASAVEIEDADERLSAEQARLELRKPSASSRPSSAGARVARDRGPALRRDRRADVDDRADRAHAGDARAPGDARGHERRGSRRDERASIQPPAGRRGPRTGNLARRPALARAAARAHALDRGRRARRHGHRRGRQRLAVRRDPDAAGGSGAGRRSASRAAFAPGDAVSAIDDLATGRGRASRGHARNRRPARARQRRPRARRARCSRIWAARGAPCARWRPPAEASACSSAASRRNASRRSRRAASRLVSSRPRPAADDDLRHRPRRRRERRSRVRGRRSITPRRLGNNGFYLEVSDGQACAARRPSQRRQLRRRRRSPPLTPPVVRSRTHETPRARRTQRMFRTDP